MMNGFLLLFSKSGHLQWALAVTLALPWIGWPRSIPEKAAGPQPLWELDLSKFDYLARPPRETDEGYRWWTDRQSLVFTQENVLATTFEVHIDKSGPSVRDKKLPTDPYHMVALFLDAGRGELIKKGDWPVKGSERTWFFPAQNGQFILGVADKLSLYSLDLSVVIERTMPTAYGQFIDAMSSPAADTFLVLYTGGAEFNYAWKLDLLDTTHLSTLTSWTGDQAHPKWILWGNELARFSESDMRIEIPPSEPKEVPTTIELYCGYQSFINHETLAVGKFGKDGCNTMAVLSTDGRILQELHFDPRGIVDPVIASRNGKIFAVPTYATQRAPARPTVRVFRLGSDVPILTVDDVVPPQSRISVSMGRWPDFMAWWWNAQWGAVALSPEGDLLAIRAGPIVRVYRVPQEQPQ
ncbi:MAG: hypothetical protein WCD49_01060 [Candidatus Acidiferrales bacterium]